MTIEELEKTLEKTGIEKREVVKLTIKLDKKIKTSKEQVVIFKGVPGDIIDFKPPDNYVVLVKAKSLRSYIRKQKEKQCLNK